MHATQILIAVVAVLSISVVVLVATMWRLRQRLLTGIAGDALTSLEGLLEKNAQEGNIQAVARKVSDVLINQCGCDRIVFLRRKRGALTLNYYHGITRFNRRDFNLRFSEQMFTKLSDGVTLRPLDEITELLPDGYIELLTRHELNLVLPVFWRDNFYGCYFLRSNRDITDPTLHAVCTMAAHSLAAAYHIKWHESRLASASELTSQPPSRKPSKGDGRIDWTETAQRLVALLQQPNSHAIIPKVLHTVRDELHMERGAYFYLNSSHEESPRIASFGVEGSHPKPPTAVLRTIDETLARERVLQVSALEQHQSDDVRNFGRELAQAGLTHLMPFRLYRHGSGVIAFSGEQQLNDGQVRRLNDIRSAAQPFVDNAVQQERLQELSFTDNLTGLANQRYFVKRLGEEILRASRYSRELALIIFDLDDLKHVNDNFGHLAGDCVLQQLGEVLRGTTRTIDVVARYGGDEFCVIMPEADELTCVGFMERLQRIIVETAFTPDNLPEPLHCTISLGAAIYPKHADNSRDLIHMADMALLKAKEGGRNRFLIHDAQSA